jgi:hypothetical protein
MASRNEVLQYSTQKILAILEEVWADNKTIETRFENVLMAGSIHTLYEGVHESEYHEKVEQTHYAFQRSLTKSIH